MGSSTERIALELTASGNMAAEAAKARSEVSALGEVAAKATQQITEEQQRMARAVKESDGSLAGMRTRYQQLLQEEEKQEKALQRQGMAMARAEEAAYRLDAALAQQQRRMALAQEQALAMNEALGVSESTGIVGGTRRLQTAFVSAAFAGEAFTRSMAAGDGALRRVFRSISMLGFLGGPELGILTTSLSAVADGMIDMWARSEKAAKSAQLQFEKTLETLGRGTLAGAAQSQQYLYSGDPFARRGAHPGMTDAQWIALSQGQRGLESALGGLGPSADAVRKKAYDDAINAGKSLATALNLARFAGDKFVETQSALTTELARVKGQMSETTAVTDALMKKQKEMEAFQLQRLREAAARRETQRLRPEEVPLTIGNLSAQEAAFGITGRSARDALGVRGFSSIDLDYQRRDEAQRVDTESKSGGLAFRIRPAEIVQTQFHLMQVEAAKSSEEFNKYIAGRLGNSLADGLAAGITAGFRGSGIKAAFKAGSGVILAGIGGMFIDEGKVYLQKAAIMEMLVPHLFNPATAGWAAAGIGAALLGLGATLEALGSGGSRGGGGGGGYAATGNTFSPSNVAGGGGTTLIVQTVNPWSREVIAGTAYYINRGQMLNTPIPAPFGAPS